MKSVRLLAWLGIVLGSAYSSSITVASADSASDYTYTTINGTITITGYTGSGGAVTIPGTIDGLPVTSIGDYAFWSCTNLTDVTIPNSVTSIGEEAFYECVRLTGVTIGNSVTNIEKYAFGGCAGLRSITIPGGVTSIGAGAFATCRSLTSVTVPNRITSIEDWVFSGCQSLSSITIPNSVTTISNDAFAECTRLLSITIPNRITSIESAVFAFCTGLTSVTIPDNVTNLGSLAFWNCTNLASVTIPKGVTRIGISAFYDCTGLREVYFKGNAPSANPHDFHGASNATIYYLAGTTGWGPTFADLPTKLWEPPVQPLVNASDASFGVRTNQFGFNITGTSDLRVVVEACADLANPTWLPVQTNTLVGGSVYFGDPRWTNYPARFYRLRSL